MKSAHPASCFDTEKYVKIKKNTIIYSNVSIYNNTIIGENCIIHAGAVIGADGFGFINRNKKNIKHLSVLHFLQ